MTQKEKVLGMLRDAGERGIRSDEFYKAFLPRAGARVHELRSEGFEITSESEQQFCRYTLVGSSAEGRGQAVWKGPRPANATPSVASSEVAVSTSQAAAQGRPGELGDASLERSVPSMFDPDVSWS